MSPAELLAAGSELLYREGYYLDRQQWQDWLALYTEDCVLWAPSWVGEHAQITDPQTEISLLYLAGHGRLLELDYLARRLVIEHFARLRLPGRLFININPEVLMSPDYAAGLR